MRKLCHRRDSVAKRKASLHPAGAKSRFVQANGHIHIYRSYCILETRKVNLLSRIARFVSILGMSKGDRILTLVFLAALVLGPGPGAMLIDGSVDKPALWFGIPALYVWALLWFLILSGCVVTAALTSWKKS
ncbi:MAG: hypothetical protein AB8D78_02555 [Akkermansiaceae bacterium]